MAQAAKRRKKRDQVAPAAAGLPGSLSRLHQPSTSAAHDVAEAHGGTKNLVDASRGELSRLLGCVSERKRRKTTGVNTASSTLVIDEDQACGAPALSAKEQHENGHSYSVWGPQGQDQKAVELAINTSTADDGCRSASGNEASSADNCLKTEHEDEMWEDVADAGCSGRVDDDDAERAVDVEGDDQIPDKALKRKPSLRRASAADKEFALEVHKAHLLCLLARGLFVDAACDNELLQASLLSLMPDPLLASCATGCSLENITRVARFLGMKFKASPVGTDAPSIPFGEQLTCALGAGSCTPEALSALSVALCRALNWTTRYVRVLDVSPLKPDASLLEFSAGIGEGFWSQPLLQPRVVPSSSTISLAAVKLGSQGESLSRVHTGSTPPISVKPRARIGLGGKAEEVLSPEASLKRKGDEQLEREIAMAIAATAIESPKSDGGCSSAKRSTGKLLEHAMQRLRERKGSEDPGSPQFKRPESRSSLDAGVNGAVWSSKHGLVTHWAEVFCEAEGRWVHMDGARGVVDRAGEVESLAGRGRPLAYVVAFAGRGAKDVTRRYVARWSMVEKVRLEEGGWWHQTMSPLRQREVEATEGRAREAAEASVAGVRTRSTLEDVELKTKELTEALPTNQQAYKTHPLYALERWLTKYQVLHPKGPVVGFCAGQPVYPRSCVQTLHTKDRWLREMRRVRDDETPCKVVKMSALSAAAATARASSQGGGGKSGGGEEAMQEELDELGASVSYDTVGKKASAPPLETELFGIWQTDSWRMPPARDGIVPKNERGHVDVWNENCLPEGTVHLRLPYLGQLSTKLGIDYAMAMVGFEIRDRRSAPKFDGVVICKEFEETLLAAHAEDAAARTEKQRRKRELEAAARWRHLLKSIEVRQRLKREYEARAVAAKEEAADLDSGAAVAKEHKLNDHVQSGQASAAQRRGQELRAVEAKREEEELVRPANLDYEVI